MHLYSLTTGPCKKSYHNSPPHKHHTHHYQLSLADDFHYQFCLASANKVHLLRLDIPNGRVKEQFEVRSRIGRIREVAVSRDVLVVIFEDSSLRCIRIEKVAAEAKQSIYLLDQGNFFFSCSLINQKHELKNFKTLWLQQTLIGIYITGNHLLFQEISDSITPLLKAHITELGFTENDILVSFEICEDLSPLQCSTQLVIVLVRIMRASGEAVDLILEVLWDCRKYQTFRILQGRSSLKNPQMHICCLPNQRLVVAIENMIIIAQRQEKGWVVLCLLPTQAQIEGIILIQTFSKKPAPLLVVSFMHNKQRTIGIYDISALLRKLSYDPVRVNADESLEGRFQGLKKYGSQAVLFVAGRIFFMGPLILKLSRLINQSTLQIDACFEKEQLQHFLPFAKFKEFFVNKSAKGKQYIDRVFSAKMLRQAIDEFAESLSGIFSSLENLSYFLIKALLRQLSAIAIYLHHFVEYINGSDSSSSFIINKENLLHEVRALKYGQISRVQEPIIFSLIRRNINAIRDNVVAMLTLFRPTSCQSQREVEFNSRYFRYYKIFDQFKFNQTLHFFRDHTALVERVTFMLYYVGHQQDHRLWLLYRSLLQELIGFNRNYHPLIYYLCNDMVLYTTNKYHLNYCLKLAQEEEKQAEILPSLKDYDYAANRYLQLWGLELLGSFAPDELKEYKYKSDQMLVAVPERLTSIVKAMFEEDVIQFKGNCYLSITLIKSQALCFQMESQTLRHVYSETADKLHEWSYKLEQLNEIFVSELRVHWRQREAVRIKNLNIKNDLTCYSDEIYEEIGQLLKTKYQKMAKEYGSSQNYVAPIYFERVKSLATQYNLDSIFGYKSKIMAEKQNSFEDHPFSIDQSMIYSQDYTSQLTPESNENFDLNEESNVNYLAALVDKLWKLYDTLLELFNYEIDVEQELHSSQFATHFIQLVQTVNTKLRKYLEPQISHQHSQSSKIQFMRLRKALLSGKKLRIAPRNPEKAKDGRDDLLQSMMKIDLVSQCYKSSGSWLLEMEELIIEGSFRHSNMASGMFWLLEFFYQITTS